jgi:hypothetical protein
VSARACLSSSVLRPWLLGQLGERPFSVAHATPVGGDAGDPFVGFRRRKLGERLLLERILGPQPHQVQPRLWASTAAGASSERAYGTM